MEKKKKVVSHRKRLLDKIAGGALFQGDEVAAPEPSCSVKTKRARESRDWRTKNARKKRELGRRLQSQEAE